MDISKCIKSKIFMITLLMFTIMSCSQERRLKNVIYFYPLHGQDSIKNISLTEFKNGKKIKTVTENITIKRRIDKLNQSTFKTLEFSDFSHFNLDKNYELKINKHLYKIGDFKINSKSQGNDIKFQLNGVVNEVGDDNIIKIEDER